MSPLRLTGNNAMAFVSKFKANLRRGAVFFAQLDPVEGSEQGGDRPVVIVQTNLANGLSPVVTAIAMTKQDKGNYPGYIKIPRHILKQPVDSTVLINQVVTLDVNARFRRFVGDLPEKYMEQIDVALKNHLALDVCPMCHAPKPSKGELCERCGIQVQAICKKCGAALDLGWGFCPHCGTQRGEPNSEQ